MPFQLSPGVSVVEKDFSSIVPAVSTSAGAFAGSFQWGPIEEPVQITSENALVERFGRPTDGNFKSFFTAASFLSYASNMLVVRTDADGLLNAVQTPDGDGAGIKIKNTESYIAGFSTEQNDSFGAFAAKYAGTLGNSLTVAMADSATWGSWDASYKANFDAAPGTSPFMTRAGKAGSNDEVHILIIDRTGAWTGTAGSVLEKFAFLSKAGDAKKSDGSNAFYKDVLNSQSKYVWVIGYPGTTGSGSDIGDLSTTLDSGDVYKALSAAVDADLAGGADDDVMTAGNQQTAYELFVNDELYDVGLIAMGDAAASTASSIITNVAEVRKDCIVFVSPRAADGDVITNQTSGYITAITDYRDDLPSSSYAVMDSGFKYMYDRYNDKYRYVPLNGDVAGLCARADYEADAWFSPGGLNRGQIKNVVRLAVTPSKAERDVLYKVGVNPVVTFPGQGTVLFGDKTLLATPSAFDRINVRRLFIVLEKSISTAAKFQLFEFNDSFTRAQFRNLVEPFLRDVQGRRGIVDFRVKCDDTNNTGEVIDRNEFVADIFVKPNRSINFITLTFVAARSAVNFDEIGG
jgi:phage tail sheath protein FI